MAFRLDEVVQSLALQSSVNAPNEDGTKFRKFLSNQLPSQIPANESVTDEAMVGDGSARVERNVFNYYFQNKTVPVAGYLNDHIAWILLKNWNGVYGAGTALSGNVGWDYQSTMNVFNSNPKLLTMFRKLGGERFLLSTLAPNNWSISQDGEAMPNFSCDLMGTGHFFDDDTINGGDFREIDMIDVPDYEYFHGAATSIVASDGVNSYDWTGEGRLISLNAEGSNNVIIRRRPGDSFFVSDNHNSGAFARNIANGKATGAIRFKIDLGDNLPEFVSLVNSRSLTNLTIKFQGMNRIGSSNFFYEFEILSPKSKFETIEGDSDQDYGALSIGVRPLRDPVTKGRFVFRCRTNKTFANI